MSIDDLHNKSLNPNRFLSYIEPNLVPPSLRPPGLTRVDEEISPDGMVTKKYFYEDGLVKFLTATPDTEIVQSPYEINPLGVYRVVDDFYYCPIHGAVKRHATGRCQLCISELPKIGSIPTLTNYEVYNE